MHQNKENKFYPASNPGFHPQIFTPPSNSIYWPQFQVSNLKHSNLPSKTSYYPQISDHFMSNYSEIGSLDAKTA